MKTKEKIYRGCMHCPGNEDLLPLDTVLYYGFGGYTVYKNRKVFYEGDSNEKWEKYWKLSRIEKAAQKTRAKWTVVLNNPLRGATWHRKGKNKWALIETNLGFA